VAKAKRKASGIGQALKDWGRTAVSAVFDPDESIGLERPISKKKQLTKIKTRAIQQDRPSRHY